MLVIVLGSIAGRIVAGRMSGGAIGHQFDQRRTGAGARAFRRPLRYGINGEEIIAVDADAGDAVARTARCEGSLFAAGISLERRYGPLVVHHVEDDRRLIHRSEQQGMMEIGLRTAAFADPACGEMIFALDRRRHRPAHGLRELGRQIAGDRKDVAGFGVITHGQLAPLAHVTRVRQRLVHKIDQRNAARNLQPLVAV